MGFWRRPQLVWWRKAIFQIHLWIGSVVGLYIVGISVSGSALVFERELMNDARGVESTALTPQGHRLSYEQLVRVAMLRHPSESLDAIDMRTRKRQVVQIVLKSSNNRHRNVWVDAVSGSILADTVVEERHALLNFLERLHNELLNGDRGEAANGIGGAMLFALTLTGLILWWPGVKSWTRALKIQWRAKWRRIVFDLHSAVGIWSLLLVGMWGLSGFYFAYPQASNRLLGLFSNSPTPKNSVWQPGQKLLPIDTYLNTAKLTFPASEFMYLYMDVYRPGGQVTVFSSRDPAKPMTLSENIVRLSPATGEVLVTESSDWWSLKEKVVLASYAIHFGDFGGFWSKAAWVLLGLTPAILAITGYVMWWNRLLGKKWETLRRKEVAITPHHLREESEQTIGRL